MQPGRASARLRQHLATLTAVFPVVGVVVCCLLPGWPLPVFAATPETFLEQARQEQLAAQREWQILLHYKPQRLGGVVSLIDDPAFFLAPAGKHDPQAELQANLAALFLPADPEQPQQHVRCRFPARSRWLSETLGIAPELLPPVACRELDQAMAQVAPQRPS